MVIRVRQGKGKLTRLSMLSPRLLHTSGSTGNSICPALAPHRSCNLVIYLIDFSLLVVNEVLRSAFPKGLFSGEVIV